MIDVNLAKALLCFSRLCGDEGHTLTMSERRAISYLIELAACKLLPKRTGKPPAPKLRIAAEVIARERCEPKRKRESIVCEVAAPWKVVRSTVYAGLKLFEAQMNPEFEGLSAALKQYEAQEADPDYER